MNAAYQTLIVKFSEPIKVLDGIFDDAEAWGVDTLKGWIDDYESSRFTAINSHTAVITSEYNMECLMVETKHTHCRDNRMLNKLAVSAPPTYNQEKHDSEDYFTADRRQTLCRHDGKQGLYRYG